jgi:hypothetical protein
MALENNIYYSLTKARVLSVRCKFICVLTSKNIPFHFLLCDWPIYENGYRNGLCMPTHSHLTDVVRNKITPSKCLSEDDRIDRQYIELSITPIITSQSLLVTLEYS